MGCSEPLCALRGTTKVFSDNGVATFTSLAITKAAPGYYLRFTADRFCSKFSCVGGWSLSVTSARFDVLVGKFAALTILQAPSIGVEGRDLVPSARVAATDAGGNFITESSFDVHARKRGGFGDLLSRNDVFFRSADDGIADFGGLFFDLPSVYDIIFNATVDNVTAEVVLEDVYISGKEHTAVLEPLAQPLRDQVAYEPLVPQPIVRLQDIFGALVTASTFAVTAEVMAAGAAGAAAGLDLVGASVVPVVEGVARFTNIAVSSAGREFEIVFTAPGVNPATSQAFDVIPGLAAEVAVVTQPGEQVEAGRAILPAPAAAQIDIGGNVVQKSAPLAVSLVIEDVAPFQKMGAPPAELNFTGAGPVVDTVNGTARFPGLRINVAGSYRLLFSRLTMTTRSSRFEVVPGYPIGLYLQREPGGGITGFELQPVPVVAFQDVYGNFVPTVPNSPSIKASLKKNAGNSTLLCGGRYPCTRPQVAGRTLFDGLGVNNVGRGYVIEFEALLPAQDNGEKHLVRVLSRAFDVAGLARAAAVTSQPQAGQCEKALPGLTSVALQDEFGNFAVAASDLVSATIRSVGAQQGSPPAITGQSQAPTVNGVAHFSDLRVDRAGTYVLIFSFGLMDARVESSPFEVTAGEPRFLTLADLPAATAGLAFFPLLSIIDACGNTAAGYPAVAEVSLSSFPPHLVTERGARMSGSPAEIVGSGPLNVTIDIKGDNYQLVVRATFPGFPTLPQLSLTSANFSVVVGALHHLQVDGLSTSGVAGKALTPPALVTARDVGNNVVPTFNSVVRARRLRGNTATSLLEGEVYVRAENGLATFSTLRISEKDPAFVIEFQFQEDFNVPTDDMIAVQSREIEITGAARTMRVYQAIDAASGGDVFKVQPVLAVFDQGGIIVPSYPFTVEVRVTDGGDEVSGTRTVPFEDGIAHFTDLALMTQGSRSVQFVSTSFVAQQTFTVSIGPAVKVVVLTQPTDFFAYRTFETNIEVAVQDRGSNAVLDVFQVRASVRANRQVASLLGVTTRQTQNGVALFEMLRIDAVGSGFTILFEATLKDQRLSVISDHFSLWGKLGGIVATQFPSGGVAYQTMQPPVVLRAMDEAYNLCPWYEDLNCQVALQNQPDGAAIVIGSTTSATMRHGVATFTNLQVDTRGSGYRFGFTCSGGYRTVTTNSPFFTVTAEINSLRLEALPDLSTFQVGKPLVPLPELRVYDANNDVVSGSVDTVNVHLVTATTEEAVTGLNGTTRQIISGGIVRFTDLTPYVLGGAFKLKFVLVFSTSSTDPLEVSVSRHRIARASSERFRWRRSGHVEETCCREWQPNRA